MKQLAGNVCKVGRWKKWLGFFSSPKRWPYISCSHIKFFLPPMKVKVKEKCDLEAIILLIIRSYTYWRNRVRIRTFQNQGEKGAVERMSMMVQFVYKEANED